MKVQWYKVTKLLRSVRNYMMWIAISNIFAPYIGGANGVPGYWEISDNNFLDKSKLIYSTSLSVNLGQFTNWTVALMQFDNVIYFIINLICRWHWRSWKAVEITVPWMEHEVYSWLETSIRLLCAESAQKVPV